MKTLKYILLLLMVLGCGFFTSCKDEEVAYAPLSVTKISSVVDRETAITMAGLSQCVIIQGTGLDAVDFISINSVPVDLKNAFLTPTELTFPIPRVIPESLNNKVIIGAGDTKMEYPLEVFIPDLRVDGMFNEFVAAGDTMRIIGDFFDLYEITAESGQLLFGDKELDIARAVQDTLFFVLPDDAVAGTKIKLISPVCGERLVPGRYHDRGYMMCDYDPYTGWGGGQYLSNGPEPAPFSGQYSRFKLKKGDAADWEWSGTVSIALFNFTFPSEVLEHQGDYEFKFEVNTMKPLAKRTINFYIAQMCYGWTPFVEGLPFKTNEEWKTITIDLFDMLKGEAPANTIMQFLGNTLAEDTDICFDNFRIVSKK